MTGRQKQILTIIVFAQFMCTSLWFAGNAVITDLIKKYDLDSSDLGYVTSSVQFGFIIGTLIYAILTVADRFHSSRVFFFSALLGAACNLPIIFDVSFFQILLFRFMTGFFLAGIYPVGMKIASDYFEKGLGKALGFLVGALVLGTSLPHFLASIELAYDWSMVMKSTSGLAITGGLLILLFVPSGPYRRQGSKLKFGAIVKVFKIPPFRAAAFGYFGHMWELYAFWAFVPIILAQYRAYHMVSINVSFLSFLVIGLGGLSCVIGGYLSDRWGTKRIAMLSLSLSGICCLLSPIMFMLPTYLFVAFLILWGLAVIADSPLFSTLVAQYAKPELKGTALTIVTCIGFGITIVSIQLLSLLVEENFKLAYMALAIGPLMGVIYLMKPTSSS